MKKVLLVSILISISLVGFAAKKAKKAPEKTDREKWVELCYNIAAPVLENMSRGELQKNMELELSPNW
ncbi:MAG: hypothetical protein K2H39_07140, partial [Paramuribaculum sp.]|nr:hypothetical protein [Paramuribaculum sp.]